MQAKRYPLNSELCRKRCCGFCCGPEQVLGWATVYKQASVTHMSNTAYLWCREQLAILVPSIRRRHQDARNTALGIAASGGHETIAVCLDTSLREVTQHRQKSQRIPCMFVVTSSHPGGGIVAARSGRHRRQLAGRHKHAVYCTLLAVQCSVCHFDQGETALLRARTFRGSSRFDKASPGVLHDRWPCPGRHDDRKDSGHQSLQASPAVSHAC